MRITKTFGNISIWLKSFFNRPPRKNTSYRLQSLEEQIAKIQDIVSTIQTNIGIVAKFSSAMILRQGKGEEINSGILKVLTEHETELDHYKELLNQHADVINTMRKHVYKGVMQEESKKELDESSEITNFLDIKKKINKDN